MEFLLTVLIFIPILESIINAYFGFSLSSQSIYNLMETFQLCFSFYLSSLLELPTFSEVNFSAKS